MSQEFSIANVFAESEKMARKHAALEEGTARAWKSLNQRVVSDEIFRRSKMFAALAELISFCDRQEDYRLRVAVADILRGIWSDTHA